MPEIMKMKVLNMQVLALATEGRTDRPGIVWKNSPEAVPSMIALRLDDHACVIPADIEEGNALIVSALATRVFAIPNEEHPAVGVEIRPFDATYLFLTHCCRNREPDDAAQRDLLSRIGLECGYEPVELVLCGAEISFGSLSDEAEPSQGNSS
jgi:hypothetical protein